MSPRTFLSYEFSCRHSRSRSLTPVVLTDYSFLTPLKRQRAVRNRNSNVRPTPSSHANHRPVISELSAEQGATLFFNTFIRMLLSPPPLSITSKEKRLSRYGMDEFAFRDGSAVVDACQSTASRTTPRAPLSSVKQMHRSMHLSAFDIFPDTSASEPASPVSETSFASSTSTRPRGIRTSPHRTRSPTRSLTSTSVPRCQQRPALLMTSGLASGFPARPSLVNLSRRTHTLYQHPLFLSLRQALQILSSSPSSLFSRLGQKTKNQRKSRKKMSRCGTLAS
jgi:hypothetical protein